MTAITTAQSMTYPPTERTMDMTQMRAFAYGDGFFSTMGVHDGQIVGVDGHRLRITNSLSAFGMQMDVDGLMAQLGKCAKQMQQGIIKVIISRQAQAVRGYGYLPTADGMVAMADIRLIPSALYAQHQWHDGIPIAPSITMTTLTSTIGHRTARLAGLKLIACPEQVLAHAELLERQQAGDDSDDGLIANVHGQWVCATVGNIFYQLDGHWYTPPVDISGVAGVMRQMVMAKAVQSDKAVQERILSDDDLPKLQALCMTNAVRGIVPVAQFKLAGVVKPLQMVLPIGIRLDG